MKHASTTAISKKESVSSSKQKQAQDKQVKVNKLGFGFTSPAELSEDEGKRPPKIREKVSKPKISKGEAETKKVIEMIMPVIAEQKKSASPIMKQPSQKSQKEVHKPSLFGMIDDSVKPTPLKVRDSEPFVKKREAKADSKIGTKLGKLGSNKLSKQKTEPLPQPDYVEQKPQKF